MCTVSSCCGPSSRSSAQALSGTSSQLRVSQYCDDGSVSGFFPSGLLPFMEIKVGYFLSDLTQHNSGALCVVPGSHLRKPQELRDLDYTVDPNEVVELNFRPGTALLWRTAVWLRRGRRAVFAATCLIPCP